MGRADHRFSLEVLKLNSDYSEVFHGLDAQPSANHQWHSHRDIRFEHIGHKHDTVFVLGRRSPPEFALMELT
jgi:hypothetical protein